MIVVTDEMRVDADVRDAFASVWNAAAWPDINPNVVRVEMLDDQECSQRFKMTVLARGAEHTVESVRAAVPWTSITYEQVTPPTFLKSHTGDWAFAADGGNVTLRLTHRAEVDYPKALAALGVASAEEADEAIASTLRANGRTSLQAFRRHLATEP